MHHYTCYGLNIQSELDLPFITGRPTGPQDLCIRFGKACEYPIDTLDSINLGIQANHEAMFLHVHDIAKYLICHKREIIVEPYPKVDLESIKNFLIGAALPYLLVQRGALVFRAAAFTMDGKSACLLLGPSGVGKSTILTSLSQDGAQILTDQCAIIEYKDNQFWVEAGFPFIKLWKDATRKLKLDERLLVRVRPNLGRYYTPLGPRFHPEALPIRSIFFLKMQNRQEETGMKLVRGVQKAKHLNLFQMGHALFEKWELNQAHLKLICLMAQKITYYENTYVQQMTDVTTVKNQIKQAITEGAESQGGK